MRRIGVELQPAQAVALRMQALQLDLQRAHQHLRRERRNHGGPGDRWGLEQTDNPPQDEDWLITYLDMVTLLMVAMIVMLAFAGPVSKHIKAVRHEPVSATTSLSTARQSPRPMAAVRIPAPEDPAPYPAAPAEVFERSALPPTAAPAPLAGTFPEPPVSPGAGNGRDDIALSARADSARITGMRSRPPYPDETLVAEPAIAAPHPSPSEGEAMAASLPLGELGKDVEVIVNKRSVSFRVNSEILFDTGQTDLSREGLAVLKRMAHVLVSAGYDITVEGHTDSIRVRSSAPYPSNWELSSARAGSVVRYLQSNGIPKSHLKAVGFADSRPIADNGTPEGRARNRRVELVVSKHHDE